MQLALTARSLRCSAAQSGFPITFAKVRVAGSNPVVRSNQTGADLAVSPGPGSPQPLRLRIMPIRLPINPPRRCADALVMRGSMRQRSPGSSELRVFAGSDPDTGRRRYRTATVRGNRADATSQLAALVASVRSQREIGALSLVSDLLEAWFAIASTTWAPTTVRQTRSVLDRYLHPHIGTVAVGELTIAAIDALYAQLRSRGGMHGQPLPPGPWHASTWCFARHSPRHSGGAGSGTTPPNAPTA